MKSLDEFLPRHRAARIAKYLSATSLVAFGVTAYSDDIHFIATLGAWFALCFFVCHWIAASYSRLTITQSRAIDYVYLGVATVGIFLLAMNYEEDRYQYTMTKAVAEAKVQLQKTKENLGGAVLKNQQTLCQMNIVNSMPEYCTNAKQLLEDFKVEDQSKYGVDGSSAIKQYLLNTLPPKDADETKTQIYRIVENELLMLRSAQLSVTTDTRFIEVLEPLPREAEEHPAWQIFTWPFILAFAFALRLTRTTIEVFDWT